MSDKVKRYTFDARAGTLTRYAEGAQMILSADGEMVPADDHDAAIAALGETIHIAWNERDEVLERMASLEARNEALIEAIDRLFSVIQDKGQPLSSPENQALINAGDTIAVNEGNLLNLKWVLMAHSPNPAADEKAGPSSVDRGR